MLAWLGRSQRSSAVQLAAATRESATDMQRVCSIPKPGNITAGGFEGKDVPSETDRRLETLQKYPAWWSDIKPSQASQQFSSQRQQEQTLSTNQQLCFSKPKEFIDFVGSTFHSFKGINL